MAEGGQKEAELKAGRSEEQTRNSIERRHGEEAVTEKVTVVINLAADNGQRAAQRAIRIAGGAPTRSSQMHLESLRATSD